MSKPIKVSGPENTRWPEYRCHKVVAAVKVLAIDGEWMTVDAPGVGPLLIGPDWQKTYKAEVGGYVVAYQDGYMSFSPAKAFEEGYTRIE